MVELYKRKSYYIWKNSSFVAYQFIGDNLTGVEKGPNRTKNHDTSGTLFLVRREEPRLLHK